MKAVKVRVKFVFQHGFNFPGIVEVPHGSTPEGFVRATLGMAGGVFTDVSGPTVRRLVSARNLIYVDVQEVVTDGE